MSYYEDGLLCSCRQPRLLCDYPRCCPNTPAVQESPATAQPSNDQDVLTVARYTGVSADQVRRFLGALELCGYRLSASPAPSASTDSGQGEQNAAPQVAIVQGPPSAPNDAPAVAAPTPAVAEQPVAKDASPEKGEQGERVPPGLLDALRHQGQCDEDGTNCIVSREAVDDAIKIIESIALASPSVSAPDSQGAKVDGGKLDARLEFAMSKVRSQCEEKLTTGQVRYSVRTAEGEFYGDSWTEAIDAALRQSGASSAEDKR